MVIVQNTDFTYNETTDGSGNFTIPTFFGGNYEVIAGQWGYVTHCENSSISAGTGSMVMELTPGIYDDFTFDFGWSVSGSASAGVWERGVPNGTSYNGETANPDADLQSDCGGEAYVTGNMNNAGAGNDDVDDGNTVLTSPIFNLIPFGDPYIEYNRWFFNDGGVGAVNDTLHISISNGTQTELVESITDTGGTSAWQFSTFRVSDYITPASTMMLIAETSDQQGSGHLLEAGLDVFRVTDSAAVGIATDIVPEVGLMAYPNPFKAGFSITYETQEMDGYYSIRLLDMIGRQLLEYQVDAGTGTLHLTPFLGAGIYLLQIAGDGAPLQTIKMIRQ
jgi:hypothetical protein